MVANGTPALVFEVNTKSMLKLADIMASHVDSQGATYFIIPILSLVDNSAGYESNFANDILPCVDDHPNCMVGYHTYRVAL